MSKSKMSPRLVISRIALFAVVGSFLLIFMAAGTSAAGFSFMDPVMAFFGLPGSNAGAATANRLAQPNGLNGGASQGASVLPKTVKGKDGDVIVGECYYNDRSPALQQIDRRFRSRPFKQRLTVGRLWRRLRNGGRRRPYRALRSASRSLARQPVCGLNSH